MWLAMGEKGSEQTLVIIKPDGVKRGLIGNVIGKVKGLDLEITRLRRVTLSSEDCQKLYAKTRQERPEIYRLVENYMTSDPSFVVVAEGKQAVGKVCRLRGVTDLCKAELGTIRYDFVSDQMRERFVKEIYVENVMHASANSKEAEKEICLFFPK